MNEVSSESDLLSELHVNQLVELRAPTAIALDHESIIFHLRKALAEPINFPALSLATVPGDRVVVVIAEDTPQINSVVEGALAALQDSGIEQSLLKLLFMRPEQIPEGLVNKLVEFGIDDKQIMVHNPDDEDAIAMFGVSKQGEALRLNRIICDADLVISIGSASRTEEPSFNGLYPEFSDQQTINRFENERLDQRTIEKIAQEAVEAGWMLGVGMIIQLVCTPDRGVAEVIAGEPSKVSKLAKERYRELWSVEYSSSADLVIASIGNRTADQSWRNLSRALETASSINESGASILLCSSILNDPEEALHFLAGCEDYQIAEREIQKCKLPGSSIAMQFCQSLERGSLYLFSQLPEGFVESLGISPIVSVEEIERLIENHDSTVLLHDAHRIIISKPN